MKSPQRLDREARQLFRLCIVNGRLDEGRVRQAVRLVLDAQRPGGLAVLSRFQRLARLDQASHRAHIETVAPLPPDVLAQIESALKQRYGPALAIEYANDPTLIGGVRVTVGSDVYDGTVKAALATLATRFSEAGMTA